MSTVQDLTGLGLPGAVAARLGNTPTILNGSGTTQVGATNLQTHLALLNPTTGNIAFVLSNQISTGAPVWCWNQSATVSANIFPPFGGKINGGATNANITVSALTGVVFQLLNGQGVTTESWGALIPGSGGGGSGTARIVTVSTTLAVLSTDQYIGLQRAVSPAAMVANLSPANIGQSFTIEDLVGNLFNFPVTVAPPAGTTIGGRSQYIMNEDFQSSTFRYYGSNIWSVS